MNEEIKVKDNWNLLYQEYAYAFQNYEDFDLVLTSFLNKLKIDFNNITKDRYKKYIRSIIHNRLNENKISILLNYININIDSTKDEKIELTKLIEWFKSLNYTPAPNVIIDLIEKCPTFKNLLAKIVNKNIDKIKRYGLNKVFDNELIALFIEIYCTLDNIVLEDIDTLTIDDNDEEVTIDDILSEQQSILSSLEEDEIEPKDSNWQKDEISKDIPDFMPTGVDAFFSEIKRKELEVLTKEEEYDLLTKIKNGDEEAYKYFYEHNCRLVISIAKRYRNSKVDYEDLLQEGCIGLMTAIERFELERGLRFSTYATWWIRQAILRAINKYGRKTGISINKNSDLIHYRKNLGK